jgi:serine/threonine-protein kinase haspin
MRTHLFTGVRTMYKRNWHDDDSRKLNNGHTWREFRPYSNVLWIKFLLGYVKKNFKDSDGDMKELAQFEQETKELKKRLDPRTHTSNGGFSSAGEIFEYVAQQQWISAEQVEAMGENTSFLGDSRLEE